MNKTTEQSKKVTEEMDYDVEQLHNKKAMLRGGEEHGNGVVKIVLGELIFTFEEEYSLWAKIFPGDSLVHTSLDIPVIITYLDEESFRGIKITSPGTNHTYFTYGTEGRGFSERNVCYWRVPAPKLDNIDELLLGK